MPGLNVQQMTMVFIHTLKGGPTLDCVIWLLVDTNVDQNQMFHFNVCQPMTK